MKCEKINIVRRRTRQQITGTIQTGQGQGNNCILMNLSRGKKRTNDINNLLYVYKEGEKVRTIKDRPHTLMTIWYCKAHRNQE